MSHQSQLKKLKKIWYTKLKESGFVDIERDEDALMNYEGGRYLYSQTKQQSIEHTLINREAKEEYYRMVGHFLHDHKFESPLHAKVWAYHAEGISTRDMAAMLKNKGDLSRGKSEIIRIIERLKKKMFALYRGIDDKE